MSGIAATGLRRRHSHSLGSEQTQTSPERPAERLLASIVSPDRGSQHLPASIAGALFTMLSSIDFSQQLRGSGSSNQIFLLQNNTTYLIEEDTFIGPSFFQLSASNVLNTMQFNILDFNHTTGNATSVLGQLEEDDWSGCVCLCGIVVIALGAFCFKGIEENARHWQYPFGSFSFPRIQNSFFNIVSFQTQTDRLYSNYETNYEKLDCNQKNMLDDYLREQNFLCPFTMEVFKNPYLGKNGQNYEYEFVYNYKQSCGKNPIGVQNEDVDVDSLKPNQMLKDEIDTFLTDFNTNPKAFIERLGNSSVNTLQNSGGDQVDDLSDDDLVVTIAGNVSSGGRNCFMPLGSCTEE